MKPEEMFQAAKELCQEEFSPETWLRWFNEALSDLAPVLRLETYEEFNINNANSRELPGDIYKIVKFKLDDLDLDEVGIDDKDKKNAYWVGDNQVCFPENKTGKLKLWYHRRPAKFTLGSSRPDIQEGYEDVILLYAAAKANAPDRWLDSKNDFYREYMTRKSQINLERGRQKRRARYAKATPFTSPGRWR